VTGFLVTGAAGFIGSHLADALLEDGHAVTGVDCFTDYYPRALKEENLLRARDFDSFKLIEADLGVEPLAGLLDEVEGVFHLAAQAGVRGSWGSGFDDYIHDNIRVSQRLFDVAAEAGIRIVFASSSSIYGDAETYPTLEETRASPISPYGVSKLACEALAHAYGRSKGLEYAALRYFTVYGPRQRPDMAFTRIARALLAGAEFTLLGDGTQSRDVTFVGDAVAATRAAMECRDAHGSYNIGGGSEATLSSVIARFEDLADRSLNVRHAPVAAGDVRRTAADISRAWSDLGWRPEVTLDDGVEQHFRWAVSTSKELSVSPDTAELGRG
jgi:UDP-glucose 4-epimerase